MSSSRKPAAIETPENAAEATGELADAVVRALEDVKAVNIAVLDLRGKTPFADWFVVASGNSARHLATMKRAVLEAARKRRLRPLGVEGAEDSEWQLIDLADCVVHLMRPEARAFYDLERIWSVGPEEGGTRSE